MLETSVDLIYLASNRLEFTRESLLQLERNTDWRFVKKLHLYGDQSTPDDGSLELLETFRPPAESVECHFATFAGPVNVMLYHLARHAEGADVFVKLDNDVIVPPGWISYGAAVMASAPELAFLGLEPPASRTRAPWASRPTPSPENSAALFRGHPMPTYAVADAIGGVGFMRARAFRGRPLMRQHSIYGGFTDWQIRHRDLVKGWLVPPIDLFLLDRLPIEPWRSLSEEYVRLRWQRPWTPYSSEVSGLWSWWNKTR